jgi:hypothetical protein
LSQPMIDCPSCSNEVPHGAPRCKHCFSDLTEHWAAPSHNRNAMLPVFLLAILLAGVGFGVWNQVQFQGQLGMSVVDPRGERVILVYTSTTSEPDVKQLNFSEINAVELHISDSIQGATQEVILVTSDESVTIEKSHGSVPLLPSAETLAHQIGVASVTVVGEVGAGAAIKGAF